MFDPDDLHTSYNTFDEAVVEIIKCIKPGKILDIGAGAGKYSKLIGRANLTPKPKITALEAVEGCRENLSKLYDEVIIDVPSSLYETPGEEYDLIILGDVIEHFKHSDGRDLIEYLNYRSSYILIVTPEAMPQNSFVNFYASHNSIWRPQDFMWHDLWAHSRVAMMHLFLLRGYLKPNSVYLLDIVNKINSLGLVGTTPNLNRMMNINLELHNYATKDKSEDGSNWMVYRAF